MDLMFGTLLVLAPAAGKPTDFTLAEMYSLRSLPVLVCYSFFCWVFFLSRSVRDYIRHVREVRRGVDPFMATMTPESLRQAGLDALRREPGAAGMVRFLQQFEIGNGDYTVERWQWLSAEDDVDSLMIAIQQAAGVPAQPES